MTWLVPLIVLVPLIGAALALTAARAARLQIFIAQATLVLALAVSVGLLVAVTTSGEALVVQGGGWLAPFGISLVVDQLSAMLVVVTSIVLLAVMAFSIGQGAADGDDETPVSIFYPTYLVLSAGVYNAFIAGDLFNMYVGFEILLVSSFVLITLGGTTERIKAGVTYIVVSLVSSFIFLGSIALIYGAVGTVNFAEIAVRMAELPQDVQLMLHMPLLIAFAIKAALFPLSFWLPDSYPSAPAPVTAVFAGLLTKVGVYAILRTETLLFWDNDISVLLMVIALLTMIVGILGAVAQAGIRRMLSFTLVSHIGYMIFGVALGTEFGYAATVFYIVHHIIVQTALFLVTGLIERIAGSSSLTHLGGMLKRAPFVAVLFFIPMLNLGGIPPFSGFIGKVGLFTAGAAQGSVLSYVLIGAGAVTSLLTLYALIRVWNLGFWRTQEQVVDFSSPMTERISDTPESAVVTETKSSSRLMTIATTTMVAVSVAITVFAGPIYEWSETAAFDLFPAEYISSVSNGEVLKP